jgi:hypothetical protein
MMKLSLVVPVLAGLALAACSKPDSGAPSPAPNGSASAATAATTAAAAATTTAAAQPAAPAAAAYVQKGIPAGKVVVGYIADPNDPSECIVATDAPEKKDQFAKDGDKLAAMFKGKVVSSCPTTNVVGTCSAGFGVLLNYYGPKWAADAAQKDCASQHGTWVP